MDGMYKYVVQLKTLWFQSLLNWYFAVYHLISFNPAFQQSLSHEDAQFWQGFIISNIILNYKAGIFQNYTDQELWYISYNNGNW
jgi:hypothetical protein